MISDAVHSASDVFATLIVILGVWLAKKAADTDHPYGHERLECVAAVALAVILGATGLGIGWSGLQKILWGRDTLTAPGMLALAAAVLSIVTKEAMYWYTRGTAKRIDSSALLAEAWHHRSDALSSVGSFIGILGARLGLPVLDPIASVVICLFILKVALDILRDAIGKMTDHACPPEEVEQMRGCVLAQPGVLGVDALNTRLFGDRVYVDVEIRANRDLPLWQAHATAQKVHDALEGQFPRVKHCMVHVNPDGEGG
jgi:cation diffusion facilitator family transporter